MKQNVQRIIDAVFSLMRQLELDGAIKDGSAIEFIDDYYKFQEGLIHKLK